MGDIAWDAATWLNPPPRVEPDGPDLLVTTGRNSDFWRTTSYGFVRDSGHALLAPLPPGSAVEVTFLADFDELYDQAGVLVRVDPRTWIKAGVEFTDGEPHLGAVVTNGMSDWSLAPVPDWAGRPVTIRASRTGDALTVRATVGGQRVNGQRADGRQFDGRRVDQQRVDRQPWRTIRLAPLAATAYANAGPFCCSPERAGLTVRFTRFAIGPADAALHAVP